MQSNLAAYSNRNRVQTATALGKLGHPDGELNLTRAAGKNGVLQMVNIRDSLPHRKE